MPSVLVRDLPDDVHAALSRKAEQRHQSLQQYLSSELRRLAERQDVAGFFAEVENRSGGAVGLSQAVLDLTSERARQ